MSSCVILRGPNGFVVSTDSIVYKFASDKDGKVMGKVKGSTRKLFQIDDDILVAGTGNWNSYFPIFNAIAALDVSVDEKLKQLHEAAVAKAADSCVFAVYRSGGEMKLDTMEATHLEVDRSGVVAYPDPVINRLFVDMYESETGISIRRSGMLGIAAILNGYNALAATMCSDISAPFDTVLFLQDGVFPFSGGVTKLPVATFI